MWNPNPCLCGGGGAPFSYVAQAPYYNPRVGPNSGIWFAVLIILFILLLIFGGYWYFCNYR